MITVPYRNCIVLAFYFLEIYTYVLSYIVILTIPYYSSQVKWTFVNIIKLLYHIGITRYIIQ